VSRLEQFAAIGGIAVCARISKTPAGPIALAARWLGEATVRSRKSCAIRRGFADATLAVASAGERHELGEWRVRPAVWCDSGKSINRCKLLLFNIFSHKKVIDALAGFRVECAEATRPSSTSTEQGDGDE
jgi:hypothetical protein